ncbi:MAG: hypothetical protein ACK5B3_10825 [Bacteroidota bacterium]|jgi:hypothetical protein
MNQTEVGFNQRAVNRLTALWALNESGLGGVLHAAKFPFTGIFVGGFAVILISLIARYSNYSFKSILKSTAMVLMIKAAVSPHSPFPAYIAVSFQGLLGAILFSLSRNFKLTPIIFGGLALLESAIQKILLTVLFFGMSFWKSVDDFVLNTLKTFQLPPDFSFSEWIALSYVVVYFILGLIIGRFASQIPAAVSSLDFSMIIFSDTDHPVKQNRKRRKRMLLITVLSVLLSIQLLDVFLRLPFGQFFFRVVFFMLLFYYVVGPLTTQLIKFLSRNRAQEISDLNNDVAQLRDFVKPVIKHVNVNFHGLYRFKMFVLYMIAISLNDIKSDNE